MEEVLPKKREKKKRKVVIVVAMAISSSSQASTSWDLDVILAHFPGGKLRLSEISNVLKVAQLGTG